MTRPKKYAETIQTWPGGQSFTFRGDPEGPPNQRSIKNAAEGWRKGSEDEWRRIRIARRAEMYAARDILCCDSSLVDDLIKAAGNGGEIEGFAFDDLENLYRDPSNWTLEECREYLRDYGATEPTEGNVWKMDRDDLIEQLANASIETRDEETTETLREAVIANIDDETIVGIDDWREACRDVASENPAEVYEWWRVTGWLCEQLRAIGEVVIDNNHGYWWGRTCTGQGLIMDGTLQQIAATFEEK